MNEVAKEVGFSPTKVVYVVLEPPPLYYKLYEVILLPPALVPEIDGIETEILVLL